MAASNPPSPSTSKAPFTTRRFGESARSSPCSTGPAIDFIRASVAARGALANPPFGVSPRSVTVVYIVISHRNPEQVVRLVRVLREGPAARVLVRHDPRWEPLDNQRLEAAGGLTFPGRDYPVRPLADIEADRDGAPADARLGLVRPGETRRPAAGDD